MERYDSATFGAAVAIRPIFINLSSWDRNCCDSFLSLFGVRKQPLKMVVELLNGFLKTKLFLIRILRSSKLFEKVSWPGKRKDIQPALIISAFVAGLCDLNFAKAEQYTADTAMADARTQKLVVSLR